MKSLFLMSILLVFVGCVTAVEETKVEDEKVFSITKSVGVTGAFILIGSFKDCNIKWEAQGGVLTHRSACSKAERNDVLAIMTEMAVKYRKESPIKIDYIRFTSKDFKNEEARLAKMVTQSKMWNKYSKLYSKKTWAEKKKSEFQNDFLKKIMEKKKVFALVPVAFKQVGYKFKYDQIEVTKMSNLFESKYKNVLTEQFKTKKSLLVPENIKVVLKREY